MMIHPQCWLIKSGRAWTHMHSERFEDVVGVLVNDTLSTLAERFDRAVVPPLSQISVFVVLTTCV